MIIPSEFSAEAFVFRGDRLVPERISVKNGAIVPGDPGYPEAGFRLAVFPDCLNAHTHCADFGMKIPPGLSLEELVAPPDGLKHRYLRDASAGIVGSSMREFRRISLSSGSVSFIDFRENGAEGCRLLRENAPEAIILGRPASPEFDPEEMEKILEYADGIGLSSVSDVPGRYLDDIADFVRSKHSVLAIHASERIREDIGRILSLDPAFVVHMCEAEKSDIAECADSDVPIAVCPGSNAYFGKTPPLAEMFSCGAAVALGTDNGMFRAPDLASEASLLLDIIERQNCDPGSVFGVFTALNGKILNHKIRISHSIQRRVMAVPFEGEPVPGNIFCRSSHGISLKPQNRSDRNGV